MISNLFQITMQTTCIDTYCLKMSIHYHRLNAVTINEGFKVSFSVIDNIQ